MPTQFYNTKGITMYRVPWNIEFGADLNVYKKSYVAITIPELHDCDLWIIDLEAITLSNTDEILSAEETARLQEIRIPKQRMQRLKSRVLLRQILGVYLNEDPAAIQFDYNVNGKPKLAANHNCNLSFNVSHSETSLAVLINNTQQVGVDIEVLPNTSLALEQIGERFFSDKELRNVKALPESDKKIALLRLWTIKEAILKAKGLGVFVLDQQECLAETQVSGSKTVLPLRLHQTIGFSTLLETHLLACIRCEVLD